MPESNGEVSSWHALQPVSLFLVAEFVECPEEVEMGNEAPVERLVGVASIQGLPPWELYVDGAANQRGSGVGLVLVSLEKITI